MPVELAELRARRKVLAPLIEVGGILAQAPRPQPIDQKPYALAARPRIVRTLDPNPIEWLSHISSSRTRYLASNHSSRLTRAAGPGMPPAVFDHQLGITSTSSVGVLAARDQERSRHEPGRVRTAPASHHPGWHGNAIVSPWTHACTNGDDEPGPKALHAWGWLIWARLACEGPPPGGARLRGLGRGFPGREAGGRHQRRLVFRPGPAGGVHRWPAARDGPAARRRSARTSTETGAELGVRPWPARP